MTFKTSNQSFSIFVFHLAAWLTTIFLCSSQAFNFELSQPQIYIEDGNLYISPAARRNLYFVANGTGNIKFNDVELKSLIYSVQNSTRDLNSFKRIFGVPTNASSGFSSRIDHLEQSFRRISQIDQLDSRLIAVERQLASNLSSPSAGGSRLITQVNSRIRRLRQRVETIETRIRSIANPDTNPCDANTCQNGGTCLPTMYGPYCWCPSGWEGNRCQTDQNECNMLQGSDLGCQNGATCVNTPGGYTCQCRSGWQGIHCTKRSGDCSTGPAWELCGHGMCISQSTGSRPFTCICDQGWKTNGISPACDVDVDECNGPHATCSRNPRVNCINTPGSFHCGPCPAGYTGNGYNCDDINECMTNNGGCSMNPMVQCINTVGSRTCGECPPGYMGNGIMCQYVGMCQMNNGGCHPLSRCVQNAVIGQSFVQCICPAGYTGTGMGIHGCYPYNQGGGGTGGGGGGGGGGAIVPTINACSSNPCVQGTCYANGNTFTCSCFPGYMGPTCGIRIDPCVSNPCSNGGTCVASMSGFICRCPNEFTGDLCETQEESCGGLFTEMEGSLRYPHSNTEQYNHNENCIWTIHTMPGRTLNVTFTSFNLEGGTNCLHDWLQINDGPTAESPLIGNRFCGTELPMGGTFNSTHNVLRLAFKSDGSITGLGFELQWNTTIPYCGGSIDHTTDTSNTTHGSISSPGYPGNYPHDRDCFWTLSVPLGKRIQLVFATMRLENHPNCSYDYLEVLDGLDDTAHVLAKFCNTTLPPPITSTGPFLALRFHSDHSASDLGFHIAYTVIPGVPGCGGLLTSSVGVFSSPHHPTPYPHQLECDWVIRLPHMETISLEFTTFQMEHASRCQFDYVEIREGSSPDGALVGKYCGRNTPRPYRSLSNKLFIRFRSDESVAYGGFQAKYEVACGGIYTTDTIIRSPFYPGSYPRDRDCVYLISQPVGKAIRLDFIDFELEGPYSRTNTCLWDFLEVRDGDHENSTLIGHYCGSNGPETILSSLNYLWLRFRTDGSAENKGFMANYSTIDISCGGILRGERIGTIQSPRHPEEYPHSVTCKWVIRAEPGEVIRLTWATFSLEANPTCMYDHVEVFDNSTLYSNGLSTGRWCGHNLPPAMTSTDNTMTVVFTSDHSVAHDGFMASYAILNASKTCGGNYLTQFGTLQSPGYPNNYPNRRTCAWTIKVPAGNQIRLSITDFQLENGTTRGCIHDYLEIRNGGQENSPLIGTFCNSNRPPGIIPSFSNALYLKFVSDISRRYRGFKIQWDGASTGCGGTVMGSPQGTIMSPNYPLHYGIRTECIWKITINPGSIIQLTFADLDVQRQTPCYREYLEIRDGPNRNSKLIGKYCYSDTILSVNSTTNSIRIKYLSQFGGTGRGFHLTYQTVCNRVIEGFGSVIESPNFPRPYPHNRNCTWEIRATPGNMINMSFSHFSIEGPSRNDCRHDFVKITEKTRSKQDPPTLIGKYCGQNVPSVISSTKDTVFVNFESDYSLAYNGFRLEWYLSGCGGRLVGRWGRLATPNYPRHYPVSVQCVWLITTELGSNVQLTIWDLDLEHISDCHFDYLRIYSGEDANAALLNELCVKTSERIQIQSHGNNMYVVFNSDVTVAGRGFLGTYSQIPGGCGGRLQAHQGNIYSPNWPSNYDHDDDCGWLLTVNENHVVQLEFTDFAVESHSNCSYDHVAVYDGPSEAFPQLLFHCGTSLPDPPIIKSTGNKMLVKLKTDSTTAAKGFRAKYSAGCGARLTRRSGEISTGEYSSVPGQQYRQLTNCTWIIGGESSDHVTLTFTFMDIHGVNSNNVTTCQQAYVEVLDGEDEEAPSIGRFCLGTIPPAITSRGNSLFVRIIQGTSTGHGFRAIYEISSSACGASLYSMQGSFTSPNYPVGYPMNAECVWNVQASPGNKVLLSFRQMSIEASDYCNNDFVEIHEGSSSGRLLGHYCGNEIPDNVTAAQNLWILFRSDGEGQAPGFWADYFLIHGNELNGTFGQIASPLWPNSGVYTGEFFWRVTVSDAMAIKIDFYEFDAGYQTIQRTSACAAYMSEFKIHDGYDANAPVLLSRCDQVLPDPVTSTSNVVYITWRKNVATTSFHFNLVWREIPPVDNVLSTPTNTNISGCGGNITLAPGNKTSLLSPNYPRNYVSNMFCEWFIFTDQLHRLKLKVEDFDMESHSTCNYDKVEIYDGLSRIGTEEYTLNRTMCTRTLLGSELISKSRALRVVMQTDTSHERSGFNFTISTQCGGVIRSTNGEVGRIASPNYGQGNYQHGICEWAVIVRPGRTIRVSFTDLDLYAQGGVCSTDTLILRNGGHRESPFLGQGRFCGSTRPATLETTANQLYIKFTAYTSGGRGFALVYNEVSASCGGQIQLTDDVREFVFMSPNYPSLPTPFQECEWVFSSPHNEAVQIDFLLNFEIASTTNCRSAGVEIRDGGTRLSPLINNFCREMPGTQRSTGNHLYVRYYTAVAEPRTGFKAKASISRCGGTLVGWSGTLMSPAHPASYDINLDCTWTIRGPEGSYLVLDFVELQLNSGRNNCSQDKIVLDEGIVTDLETPRNWTVCGRENGALPSRIETSTNEVQIKFTTDSRRETNSKGFKIRFRASNERCGGTLNAPSGFIQSPGYPRGYGHYRYCAWQINAPPGRRVRLEFLDFDLEEKILTATRQFCVDYVEVRQFFEFGVRHQNSQYELMYNGSLCGSTLPPPVESTSSTLNILFRTDFSVAHRGFRAKYTTEMPIVCGGTVEDTNGTGSIASPTETTNTPNTTTSTSCNWERLAGQSNSTEFTTILTINSLSIPQYGHSETAASVPCNSGGFLRLAPLAAWEYQWKKFCGSVTNLNYYLPGDSFKVTYQAYAFQQASFNVSYTISPCGGKVYGPQNISSLNFPSVYPVNTECIWMVEFTFGSQINLKFMDIDLDDSMGSDGCDKDYILVRNGRYPTSPLLGKYCGSNIPSSITSMSQYLFIEFHSDESSNGNRRGFHIKLEEVERGCGGVLHTKQGAVRSPKHTHLEPSQATFSELRRYPPNTECEWIIETIPGYKLNFRFTDRFDIETSSNCSNDYVEIFLDNKQEWKSIGKFCGKQVPTQMNTTSTKAKVIFHSNEAINGDGFTLNWFSPCGGVYSEREGEIRSAHYDRYSHTMSVHSWQYWSWVGWEAIYDVQKCDYVIQGNSPEDYIVAEFLAPFHISPPSTYGLDSVATSEMRCPIVNVTVWDGNDTSSNPQYSRRSGGIYCGETPPPSFVAKGAAVISYNYLGQFENYGFRVKYSIYQCGGIITESSRIQSPGHPFTSAPNMNCTWVIKAPRNRVVRIKIERLEMEYHSACLFDAVHVYDGSLIRNDTRLGSYCGNLTSDLRRISSSSDSMTVQFVTDHSVQHSGFSAAIDFTLGTTQNCGGRINVESGVSQNIQSSDGNNDGKYDENLDCEWLIIGPDYQSLELSFTQFNLEGSRRSGLPENPDDPCPYDYIEIRDGPGPLSDVLGKFCSGTIPPRLVSATNFMWINFVTDGSYNFPGFRATLSSRPSVCGASFALNATTTAQYLTSPSYPGNYGNNVRCRYIITGTGPTDEVDIRFMDVQIEPSTDCSKDRLQIRDVSDSYTSTEGISGPMLFNGNRNRDWRFTSLNIQLASIMKDVSYCGSLATLPPDFISVGRSAEVIFETDSGTTAKGFKLMYQKAGCNRTYNATQGRIFSPEWPANTPFFSNCVFTVTAPNNSFVSLYFNQFMLMDSTGCTEGAFEARENSESGRLIGRYCGSAIPEPIFATSNVVWVQYFTRIRLSRGYDITYTTTPNGIGCGGDLFHTGGSFTSPLYPGNFSRESDCSWRVRVPASLKLQLEFTSFNIGGDCDTNFVEISSMNSHALSEDPVLITKYCAGDTPAVYVGTTDMGMVRYKTSGSNTGSGWRIVFRGTLPTQLQQ